MRHPRPVRLMVVATAVVLAAIAASKAFFVGAFVFYALALVYIVGAASLQLRSSRVSIGSIVFADLIWIAAEGRVLLNGVPTEPLADLFVVAVGVPVALINLALSVVLWNKRPETAGAAIDETPVVTT